MCSSDLRIFAGDFNVGHSSGRLEILTRYLQSSQLHIATAQGKAKYQDLCVKAEQLCAGQMVLPSNVPLVHASDLQLYAAPGREQLEPVARAALFGSNGRSGPLSDHLGLEITYRLR